MYDRQAKFETFLYAQVNRQRVVWFSCLPEILEGLVRAINEVKTALSTHEEKNARFELNTLPKLRPMYSEIKQILKGTERGFDEERRTRELVESMISRINSWFRAARVACGVKVEMDPRYHGKAAIAAKYELLISDQFEITCNQAWK